MDAASLIVSVASVSVSLAALGTSRLGTRAAVDSARESKRSADAAEDSAASSRRAAEAAEGSAAAAVRSADAAERSANADEQIVELERARTSRDLSDRANRARPQFEPVLEHGPGPFNLHDVDPRFGATLRNTGGSVAHVTAATLHHPGGGTPGRAIARGSAGPIDLDEPIPVAPGEVVSFVFESPDVEILRTSTERPGVTLLFTSSDGLHKWRTDILLRLVAAGPGQRRQWREMGIETVSLSDP